MSMEYIRKTYGVPAKRGGHILFRKCVHEIPVKGEIVGSRGQYLRVRFPGHVVPLNLHPTWMIEYL
jgi:hypothetical protein